MEAAWERAHDDPSVLLSGFRRDGLLILSGAIAGLIATIFEFMVHVPVGLALGRGPFAYVRWVAEVTIRPVEGPAREHIGILFAALFVSVLCGIGCGVVFALIADHLQDRNSILGTALAYGFALFALMFTLAQLYHVPYGLPIWELLLSNMVYAIVLVVQQAAMDILEPYARRKPSRRPDEEGPPLRLPTLGRTG
jgi:hypothetical protein